MPRSVQETHVDLRRQTQLQVDFDAFEMQILQLIFEVVGGFQCLQKRYQEPLFTVFGGKLLDRKSTRLNSSHIQKSRMPSSA